MIEEGKGKSPKVESERIWKMLPTL